MSYPSGERLRLLLWRDALKQPKQNEIIIVIEVPPFYLYCKRGAIVEQN